MSDNSTTRIRVDLDTAKPGKTDWNRVDAMSDEEVEQAALSDPDAQPTSPEALKRFYRVVDVKAIRERLSLTQEEFANTFHLSPTVVKEWEQTGKPDPVARILLKVIAHNPEVVKEALESSQ